MVEILEFGSGVNYAGYQISCGPNNEITFSNNSVLVCLLADSRTQSPVAKWALTQVYNIDDIVPHTKINRGSKHNAKQHSTIHVTIKWGCTVLCRPHFYCFEDKSVNKMKSELQLLM
jgi:hypothetical protein